MSPSTLERPVPIDPRIQARRAEVERHEHRRRRRRLVAVLVVVGVLLAGYALVRSPLLDVDRLRIDATDHVPADQIAQAAGVAPGSSLVDVDPGAVRGRLLALPWVADATVDVDWLRGTVHLAVTERTPVATVADGTGGWIVTDGAGRALAPAAPTPDPALFQIQGVAPVAPGEQFGPAIDDPLRVLAALTPGLRTRVIGVTVAPDGSLVLPVHPQGSVLLCNADRLSEKVADLATAFAQVDDSKLQSINACVPGALVFTRGT